MINNEEYYVINTINKAMVFKNIKTEPACNTIYQLYNAGDKRIISFTKGTTLYVPKLVLPYQYMEKKINSISTTYPIVLIVDSEVGYSLKEYYDNGFLDFKNAIICVSPIGEPKDKRYDVWFNHKGGIL